MSARTRALAEKRPQRLDLVGFSKLFRRERLRSRTWKMVNPNPVRLRAFFGRNDDFQADFPLHLLAAYLSIHAKADTRRESPVFSWAHIGLSHKPNL